MLEVSDYNSEYFFDKEYELEQYNSILENFEEPSEEEKDYAYDIFTLEQAVSTLNTLSKSLTDIGVHADAAKKDLEKFIEIYSENYKD